MRYVRSHDMVGRKRAIERGIGCSGVGLHVPTQSLNVLCCFDVICIFGPRSVETGSLPYTAVWVLLLEDI